MLDGTSWIVSQYISGAPLDRLMTAAILTPFQATTVVMEIFGGLTALHRAGLAHGRLNSTSVRVGTDGMVRLTDWAFATLAAPPVAGKHSEVEGENDVGQRRDLAAAVAIAAELARNADRPNNRRGRVDAELLNGLVKLGAVEPESAEHTYEQLRRAVRRAPRPDPSERTPPWSWPVSSRRRRAPRRDPAAGGRPATPARRKPPAAQWRDRSLSTANWQSPRPRRTIVAIVATACAVVVLTGAALAPAGRSAIDRLLHHSSKPSASHSATTSTLVVSPGGKPHPVRAVAHSTGVISAVAAHAARCRRGRTCAVTITVRLTPSTTVRRVKWAITVVDRCAGTRAVRRGGTLGPPRGRRPCTVGAPCVLPAGRALGLIVTTSAPARAAAAPLLVPATAVTC